MPEGTGRTLEVTPILSASQGTTISSSVDRRINPDRRIISPNPGSKKGEGARIGGGKRTFRAHGTGNVQVPQIQTSTSIAQYVHEWRKITSDQKVINMVQGIRLEFEDILPVQTSIPRPIKFSDKDSELIDGRSYKTIHTAKSAISTVMFFNLTSSSSHQNIKAIYERIIPLQSTEASI